MKRRDSEFPRLTGELIRRLDVAGPRYTSYPTAPVWSAGFGPADAARALAQAGRPLSLYVHLPFCREMCSYCGCNVIVSRDPRKIDRYLAALDVEAELVARRLGDRRTVARLHYGGGTPTALDVGQLRRLWAILAGRFDFAGDAELAVEIDPAVTSEEQLAVLRELGFARLSMGVQDFDPEVQRAVRRIQSVGETRRLVEHARALGYRSVNLDLIYGLPKQTPASWGPTLDHVIELGPDRIALFSFAYVPLLKPHQRRLPIDELPGAPAKLELFRLAHDRFTAAGYRWIGMDHFALPTDELALAQQRRTLWRDFQGYTTLRASDTVALGVSGIGSAGGAFAQNVKSLARYAAMLADGLLPVERGRWLTHDDARRRDVITQIMCNFWVDLGLDGAAYFAPELERLAALEADGLVEVGGHEITVTPLGRVFVRNVAMVFDAHLARAPAERPTFSRTV